MESLEAIRERLPQPPLEGARHLSFALRCQGRAQTQGCVGRGTQGALQTGQKPSCQGTLVLSLPVSGGWPEALGNLSCPRPPERGPCLATLLLTAPSLQQRMSVVIHVSAQPQGDLPRRRDPCGSCGSSQAPKPELPQGSLDFVVQMVSIC